MNREQILKVRTLREEKVDVPEWGGAFSIRSLTAVERVKFFDREEAERMQKESPARLGVLLLIACCFDEQGEQVFRPEDAPELEQMDGGLINRLCAVANRVNGLSPEQVEAAKKN